MTSVPLSLIIDYLNSVDIVVETLFYHIISLIKLLYTLNRLSTEISQQNKYQLVY